MTRGSRSLAPCAAAVEEGSRDAEEPSKKVPLPATTGATVPLVKLEWTSPREPTSLA